MTEPLNEQALRAARTWAIEAASEGPVAGPDYIEGIIRAYLYAAPQQVRVKPLEWAYEHPYIVARPIARVHYAIEVFWREDGDVLDFVLLSGPAIGRKRFATLKAAKAAAQADYEARIRSTLELEPQPGWRSMDSAPRDGTRFWGRVGDNAISMLWHDGFGAFVSEWRRLEMARGYAIDGQSFKDHSPHTHEPSGWMPLPAAPADAQEGGR